MADAVLNVVLGAGGVGLALFGPWPRNSWWTARALWALAVFNVALGVVTLRVL